MPIRLPQEDCTHRRKRPAACDGDPGSGNCLDIEDLAGGKGPRHVRPWTNSGYFVDVRSAPGSPSRRLLRQSDFRTFRSEQTSMSVEETVEKYIQEKKLTAEVITWRGLPLPFWVTRLCWTIFILLWTALLISVAALSANAWYLFAIGLIGMIQNLFLAGTSRRTETRGICLQSDVWLVGSKVMDGP